MNTRKPKNLTAPLALAEHLIALHRDARAQLMPFRDKASTDADWIIGVKPVSDDASVHAGHWERHPRGDEVLSLIEGRVVVTLRAENEPDQQVTLTEGQALVVPQGTWHRLQVEQPGRLVFVTPSVGSEHRRVELHVPGAAA